MTYWRPRPGVAIAVLSSLGYTPVAVSGKTAARSFLETLGARSVLSRAEAEAQAEKPIFKACWAGGVDTVEGYSFESHQNNPLWWRDYVLLDGGITQPVAHVSLHTAQCGFLWD